MSLTLLRKPTLQTGKLRPRPYSCWRAALLHSHPNQHRSPGPRVCASRPLPSHPDTVFRRGSMDHPAPGSWLPCQNFLPRRGPSPTSFLPPAPPRFPALLATAFGSRRSVVGLKLHADPRPILHSGSPQPRPTGGWDPKQVSDCTPRPGGRAGGL